jgi:nucleoside-diphosphate-sugar epimerase
LEDANDEDLQVPPTRQQQLYGHYATTKAEAEKLVLAAHGSQGLCTIVVRAAGMYGGT